MSETTGSARELDIGDRVILAAAKDRSRTVLGTVIDRDPHPDRDVLVRVLHEDGIPRWRRRDSLRWLGCRMSADALAADLKLMGLADLNDVGSPGDAEEATDG